MAAVAQVFFAMLCAVALYLLSRVSWPGTLWQLPFKVVAVVVIGTLLLVTLDGFASRYRGGPRLAATTVVKGAPTGRLIVFLPGLATSADLSSRPILPVLQRYGDVMLVEYPSAGFDKESLIGQIRSAASDYNSVGFYGVSLGSLLALDFYRDNRQDAHPVHIDGMALLSPLSSGHDIKLPAKAMLYLPRGWLAKKLWSAIFPIGVVLQGSAHYEVGITADEIQLEQRQSRFLRNYPMEAYAKELEAIYGNRTIQPGEVSNIPVALIPSSQDELLKPRAATRWQQGAPQALVIGGPKTHAPTLNEPQTVRQATEQAMQHLYG